MRSLWGRRICSKKKKQQQLQWASPEWGNQTTITTILLQTVHSPLFSRKIVEIERYVLRAVILHECQNYLAGGGRFGRKREKQYLAPLPPELHV